MKFYRFRTMTINERVYVIEETYTQIEKTEKGAWIACDLCDEDRHFIRDKGKKKYAYPTRKEAYESFQLRQRKRVQHCGRALDIAEAAKTLSERPMDAALDKSGICYTSLNLA